jgi:abnormal spindle-like microcephaly-associated protein
VAAATKLQAVTRGAVAAQAFRASLAVAVAVQSAARGWVARKAFGSMVAAAVILQAALRRTAAQRLRARAVGVVVRLQALWRGAAASSSYCAVLKSTLQVQNWWLQVAQRRWEALMDSSAAAVQRAWRLHRHRQQRARAALAVAGAWRRRSAATLASQRRAAGATVRRLAWRALGACTPARRRFVALRALALSLQAALRARLLVRAAARRARAAASAAALLGRFVRGGLGRRRARAVRRGVVLLQARRRGAVVRKAASKNRRILAVRAKMARAAARAAAQPELRLGNRTRDALLEVTTAKKLPSVMRAVAVLETSTRLSPPCCLAFASGGAAGVLLKLAQSANRSTPHLELLRSVLATLSHVAACGPSLARDMVRVQVSEPGAGLSGGAGAAAAVLAELVANFRDKEPLFVLGVGLLESLSAADADFAASLCGSGDVAKRLLTAVTLLERKAGVVGVGANKENKPGAAVGAATPGKMPAAAKAQQGSTAGACARLKTLIHKTAALNL